MQIPTTPSHTTLDQPSPKGYENRVLHMEERDGLATWVVDGNEIGFAAEGASLRETARSSPSSMRWRGASTGCMKAPSTRRLV